MTTKVSLSKQSVFLFIIFIAVLLSCAFYYLKHTHDNELELTRRNLRLLGRLTNQINSDIAGIRRVNDKATESYFTGKNEQTSIFDLLNLDPKLDLVKGYLDPYGLYKEKVSFEVLNGNLALCYSLGYYQINIVSRMKRYIKDLAEQGVFENVFFVEDSTGRVVHDLNSRINIENIDSLKDPEGNNAKEEYFIHSDASGKIVIAGETYRLFVRPILKDNTLKDNTYTFSLGKNNEKKWVVCGIVPEDKFDAQARQISPNLIVFLLCILSLSVLGWPLLKIKFATRGTRFRVYDIIFTVLAVIFASAFLTFAGLDFLAAFKFNRDLDSSIKTFSEKISDNFLDELNKIRNQLTEYDTQKLFKTEYINPRNNNKFYPVKNFLIDREGKDTIYDHFEQIYWVDRYGTQHIKCTTKNTEPQQINIADREYFKNVINNNMWSIDPDHPDNLISLQPLISNSTGDFSVTMAIKSGREDEGFAVAGIDFKPVSLINIAAPSGFDFAVIDTSGRVLFHSKSQRNLHENLFDELEKKDVLSALINVRTSQFFKTDYWGNSKRAWVKPIPGLPWYIISFSDISHVQSTNLEIISVSSLLFFVYILPFVILFFYFLISKFVHIDWIWPHPKNAEIYSLLIICYLFLSAVLMFIIVHYYMESISLFSAFVIPHLAIILSYVALNRQFHFNKKSIIAAKQDSKKSSSKKPVIVLVSDFLILVCLILIVRHKANEAFWVTILFSSVSISICYLIVFTKVQKFIIPFIKKINLQFKTLYKFLFLMIIILGVVIPSLAFFKIGYNSQIKLYIRDKQLALAHQIENRNLYYSRIFNKDGIKEIYKNGIYDSLFYDTKINPPENKFLTNDLGWFEDTVLTKFMPSYNSVAIKEQVLASEPIDEDSVYRFQLTTQKSPVRKSFLIQKTNYDRKSNASPDSLVLSSTIPHFREVYDTLSFPLQVLVIIILGIVVYIFIRILNFAVDKVFWLNLSFNPSHRAVLKSADKLKHNVLLYSLDGKPGHKIFGNPVANKHEFPKSKSKKDLNEWFDKIQSTLNSNPGLLVIENFEMNADSKKVNELKLKFLEYLIFSCGQQIMLVSSMEPMTCFNLGNDSGKWELILSRFERKWQEDSLNENNNEKENGGVNSFDSNKYVKKECEEFACAPIADHVRQIGLALLEEYKDDELTNSEFVVKQVYERAKAYYHFIWQTCSPEERFVIGKLQQDKYLSPADRNVLSALIDLGVLQNSGGIRFCNKSFEKFTREVETEIGNTIWDMEEANSTWRKLKVPVFIVMILLTAFLFGTQPDMFNNTLTYITATTALLPGIFKLIGLFGGGKASAGG